MLYLKAIDFAYSKVYLSCLSAMRLTFSGNCFHLRCLANCFSWFLSSFWEALLSSPAVSTVFISFCEARWYLPSCLWKKALWGFCFRLWPPWHFPWATAVPTHTTPSAFPASFSITWSSAVVLDSTFTNLAPCFWAHWWFPPCLLACCSTFRPR